MSEEQLIKDCIKGRREAQEMLFKRFSPPMLAVCARYSQTTLEAEDMLQEGFIKVFAKINTFKSQSSLFFWIKRIMVNTALNFNRSKLYMHPMLDIEKAESKIDFASSLENLAFEELLTLIRELPDGCQVVFNMYAIEGYKHREISELTGISEGTSKSQYARARQILMKKIVARDGQYYGKA